LRPRCGESRLVRIPQVAEPFLRNFETTGPEQLGQHLVALARPAVAAENPGLLVLELQSLHLLENARHGGENARVHRRRTHENGLGSEDIGDGVVPVRFAHVVEPHFRGGRGLRYPLGHRLGQLSRTAPHGVVDDGDAVFLVVLRPLGVFAHDLQGILPPDDAVARRDDVDGQAQADYFVDLRLHEGAEGREDVRVVLDAFRPEFALVHEIVEEKFRGVVLAEGVVREEDGLARHIAEHGIGPVEHAGFDEHQLLAVAEVEFVARLYDMEVPVLVVLALERFHRVGRAIDGQAGTTAQQLRKGPGMVHFAVVLDDSVQLGQEALGFEIVDEFLGEGHPDRIDEDCLLLLDHVGVVARALVRRIFLAVELLELPVYLPHPGYIAFHMLFHHRLLHA